MKSHSLLARRFANPVDAGRADTVAASVVSVGARTALTLPRSEQNPLSAAIADETVGAASLFRHTDRSC